MSDNIQNEKELLKPLRSNIRYVFEKQITDENICQYIFGKKGYTEDAIRETNAYPKYFNNILSLAFYFVYACYRCNLDEGYGEIDDLKSHNAKRIRNSLENALVRYPITADLIQFVLTDIQFELAQGDKSELRGMFRNLCVGDASGFNLNPYFSLITEYNRNPARFQHSKLELMKLFLELLNNLTFLSTYQLVCDGPDTFCFITKVYADKKALGIPKSASERYDELPLYHLFFRDDTRFFGGIYRLFSIETGEKVVDGSRKTAIGLRYFTPSEDRSLSFSLPNEEGEEAPHLEGMKPSEVYEEIVGAEFSTDKDVRAAKKSSNSIDQVHTVNYKYIKNLALAISDAISANKGSKEILYARFATAYPYIFERKNREDDGLPQVDHLDWDSVVIMLLIEASPTAVLEFIIRKNKQMFYTICQNLYKRIYDVQNLAVFNDADELERLVHGIIDNKLILGEAGGFGKLPTARAYGKLFPRAATMLILSKLNDLQESEGEDNLVYTGNLRNNISLLQKANDEFDAEKRVKYACIILGETLRHLMCFYAGLFEYGKAKAGYDVETNNRTLNKQEIVKHQKTLESVFLAAAKGMAESLPVGLSVDPASAIELLDRFVEFCKRCALSNNSNMSEQSKDLHTAVGKYEIINVRKFEKLVARLKALNIAAGNAAANEWVLITLELLEYFKSGNLTDSSMDGDLFNAIYPFTAVFNKGRENIDGYKTVNFSLNIDVEDENSDLHIDINVLSEFLYDRSEAYYCLPNVIRSNYKWWIDPVLISFRDFNSIFTREEAN